MNAIFSLAVRKLRKKKMGCRESKSCIEPCVEKLLVCHKLVRSYSTPHPVTHDEQNPKCDSYHVVTLTSSTYGSLRLDSLPRTVNTGSVNSGSAEPQKDSIQKRVDAINVWRINGSSLEDEKAALQKLRSLLEESRLSGYDYQKNASRTSDKIHTIEDVDIFLNRRKSYSMDYRLGRGASIEELVPRRSQDSSLVSRNVSRSQSAMLQKRRARALQSAGEVKGSDSSTTEISPRNQETISRSHLSEGKESDSAVRSSDFAPRSLNFDSIRRINLTRSQEIDSRRRRNLSRSQEFTRFPPTKLKEEDISTRLSLDERRLILAEPDQVLRSPMLKGSSGYQSPRVRRGQQLSVSKPDAVGTESKSKPPLHSHIQPIYEKTTLPGGVVDSKKVNNNLDAVDVSGHNDKPKIGKALEPRIASAVGTFSRLGAQSPSVTPRNMSESNAKIFQDHLSNLKKLNQGVQKAPAKGSVPATAFATQDTHS